MEDYLIVGTAGHIDHGKTALVKALTGVDTDRLKEEKERGISIELGFAPLILPDGRRLGLVDVPGHERFIRQMLAGVGGIDLALLVIAADEGVMPQTREHLHILDLLRVKQGIVVLTKIDLVDAEWLELVEEEVRQTIHDTFLEGAPVVRVSALTREGIPELLQAVASLAAITPRRHPVGQARLPIDRVFSISGFGTVVTGTLWSGTIRMGQEVEVLPQGLRSKVRGLQVHGEGVPEARAGQRVAVNLTGLEVQDIKRGNVLVTPGSMIPTRRLDTSLRLIKGGRSLANNAGVHFYLGTTEVLGRVILLEKDELSSGETGLAQILLNEPVVASRGDRFIIRGFSPLETIGGGLVLTTHPPRRRRLRPEVIAALESRVKGDSREIVAGVIKESKGALGENEVALKAELPLERVRSILHDLAVVGEIALFKEEGSVYVIDAPRYNEWVARVVCILKEHHRKFPLRRGLPKEELRTRFFSRSGQKAFQGFLKYGATKGHWCLEGNDVFLPEFQVQLSPELTRAHQVILETYRQGWWQPPTWAEVIAPLGLNEREAEELLHYTLRRGELVRLIEGLYMHAEALAAAKEEVRRLAEDGPVSLGEVRDALNSSRKYVLPLLEYLDQIKFTKRLGDKRLVIG